MRFRTPAILSIASDGLAVTSLQLPGMPKPTADECIVLNLEIGLRLKY